MQGSFLCFPEAPPTARRAPASAPNTRTQSCGRGCPLSFRGFQGSSQPLENSKRPPAHPPPPPRVPPTINSLLPSPHSGAKQKPRKCRRRASPRSEEHTSELQSHSDLVCRLLLEKKI